MSDSQNCICKVDDASIYGPSLGKELMANFLWVWETPAPMGLLTSESPDCVAAWRGRQRPSPYGKPFLACDTASRVLVLPEPVYMMWPKWMNMGFAAAALQVSDTDVAQSERSNQISTSGSFVKGGNVRKLSAVERQTSRRRTSRVARSSFAPTRYSLESSSAEVVPPQPPKPPWLLEETEQ